MIFPIDIVLMIQLIILKFLPKPILLHLMSIKMFFLQHFQQKRSANRPLKIVRYEKLGLKDCKSIFALLIHRFGRCLV